MNLLRRSMLFLVALGPFATFAQQDRVTLVVPYTAGSAPDLLARLIALQASTSMARNIVVENRPGANAIIGSEYVSRARPDGTTYLLVDRMTVVANPLLYSKLSYDPKTLTAVTDIGTTPLVLTVRSDGPYSNFKEFAAYARANPYKISMGTGGNGSVHHISLELLGKALGTSFTHVPYKGSVPAVQDLLSGQVMGVISGIEAIRPQLSSGKLRVLAIGAEERAAMLPHVPTMRELGISNPVLLPTMFSLFAPPKTPESSSAAIARAVHEALLEPSTVARMLGSGVVPHPSTPAAVEAGLSALAPQLERVIKDANIRLE